MIAAGKRLWRSALHCQVLHALVVLCLVLLILFPEVLSGKVLLPADILFQEPFWREAAPADFAHPQNDLLSDIVRAFYPWHAVAHRSMRTVGRVPLWNPYELAGQPLVGNAQSALFFPPNLLLFWLDPGTVATVRAMAIILFTGLFTFLLCRRLQISQQGSLLSMLCACLAGPLVVWLGYPHANVYACLPFLMWSGEGLIQSRHSVVWTVLIAVGIGLSICGGHPEMTAYVNLVFAAYFLARLLWLQTPWREKVPLLARFITAVMLGALVGAVQLLPFAEALLQSATLAHGGRSPGHYGLFYHPHWVSEVATMVTMLFPKFYGSPTARDYYWPFSTFQNYNEQTTYFGVVPLGLAAGAVLWRRKSRPQWIILVLAVLCLGVANRVPGFEVLNHLPVISMSLTKRLRMPFVWLGAVLAGFGFDALRQRATRVAKAASLMWILALGTFAAKLAYHSLRTLLGTELFAPLSATGSLISLAGSVARPSNLLLPALVAAAAAGLAWLARSAERDTVLAGGLVLATAVELLLNARAYNPAVSPHLVFPTTRLIEMLSAEDEPFRVMSDGAFLPNYGAAYGIAQLEGYDYPIDQRWTDIYRAQGGEGADQRQRWDPGWPLINWLNVKYVITADSLEPPRFTALLKAGDYTVYRNNEVLPRAYVVHQVRVVSDGAEALEMLTATPAQPGSGPAFDFRQRVVLLEELPVEQMSMLAASRSENAESVVQFESFGTDDVRLHVQTDAPGLLVMSDVYAPGWRACIDGVEAPVVVANYAFRAVFVPAGVHQVSFFYRPESFQLGLKLSLIAVAIVVAGGLASFLRAHRSPRHA